MVKEFFVLNTGESKKNAEETLKLALAEAQQSVRSYDTKAQICGVGYIFSLNIIFGINKTIWPEVDVSIFYLVVCWSMFILPIILFGYVLYPSRKSMSFGNGQEKNSTEKAGISYRVKKLLYISLNKYDSVKKLTDSALASNLLQELAFELLKSSELRDRKRKRFLRALIISLIAFMLMLVFQFAEVIFEIS